ncbi:DUF547 domain-containing protein [Halovenus halobia]|uniref:DUF547 domain-containing protein n=1 Tax=Halovenus halobia TaxID=3396622 RepID=UPI003F5676AA
MTDDPLALAEQFLRTTRYGESTDTLREQLASLDDQRLRDALDTDDRKLAFWINLYNATTQDALDRDPEQYDRWRFFSKPLVTVAGERLSLDDIEHGILRRSFSKYTLGYARSPFRDNFIDRHELAERDPRIHFAVNCGAESCPPIAAYRAPDIDDQLNLATQGYFDTHVEYDPHAGRVSVPRLLLWYRGDFGRRRDIIEFLLSYNQLPPGVSPRLSYRDWDWSMSPDAFADEL